MTERERLARVLWFDYVDQQGYPNGLPTWDEMLSASGAHAGALQHYRSHADAILASDWLREVRGEVNPALRYHFLNGPWENSRLPTIVRDNPTGGDPIIIATISRVHRPADVYGLCAAANKARGWLPLPAPPEPAGAAGEGK